MQNIAYAMQLMLGEHDIQAWCLWFSLVSMVFIDYIIA